ncbi:MAG TPA: AraC family transcriptional regulator [Candidatus Mediterraneibacter cottocaccae]|nr:AraC family transcriptional regulator [Candidatus Mediterraneibacter cottocaccae]
MDILNESRLLIINEQNERLVDVQTVLIDEAEELRDKIHDMVEKGERNGEALAAGGGRYFISYLYSAESRWHYIKITRWDAVFGILRTLGEWTVGIVLVIILLMLLVVIKSSISIVRLQTIMQKRQSPGLRQADINQLKEGFLSDFLHSRKLFTKSQLREQMEKFGFAVSDEKQYMALLLKLEKPEQFKELYGEKGTYDIEFGYWNIFEEIYGKAFKIMGIINRDHTFTFLLETGGEADGEAGREYTREKLRECFEQFCASQKKFIQWDFFCVGMEYSVRIEEIPEANEKLKKAMRESFFYPSNSYRTMEQLLGEHRGRADFQKLDVNRLVKAVRGGEHMEETFDEITGNLDGCSSLEYMNAVSWLGISVMRGIGTLPLNEEEVNKFLAALTRCEKKTETEECFRQLFERIRQNQEKSGAKKGVAGRLDEVKKYIEENYRDPNITLERLADEFGGSPNYMGRLFKKDTGLSVAEYINEIRLREVMSELRGTTRPAKEIAEQCGFISSNYFYTYFRKKTGLTPQTYRETWKNSGKQGQM